MYAYFIIAIMQRKPWDISEAETDSGEITVAMELRMVPVPAQPNAIAAPYNFLITRLRWFYYSKNVHRYIFLFLKLIYFWEFFYSFTV